MKKLLTGLFLVVVFALSAIGFAACSPEEYNVNFIVDGETVKTVTTSGQSVIDIPSNPVKDGYTFDGWYLDNETWQNGFNSNSLVNSAISSDINVYAKFVSSHEHEYVKTEKKPTCEEGGYVEYTCSSCGDKYRVEGTNPLGHAYGDWTVTIQATCTEKGEEQSVCANDETHVLTREVDALGHDFGEWTVTIAPTCTEKGEETRVCSRCGEKETREVNMIKHDYGALIEENPAGCESEGMNAYYKCSVCQKLFDKDKNEKTAEDLVIPAIGHKFIEDDEHPVELVKPSCEDKAYTLHYCETCGKYIKVDDYNEYIVKYEERFGVKPNNLDPTLNTPLEHNYEFTSDYNATVGADGTKTGVCTRCGNVISAQDEGSRLLIGFSDETYKFSKDLKNNAYYVAVNNSKNSFDFNDVIVKRDDINVTYKLSTTDSEEGIIEGTIVSDLELGDNICYIIVYKDDVKVVTYKVTIRLFAVSFDLDGGTWGSEAPAIVQKGGKLIAPEAIPVKDGYTFDGWDYDFDNFVTFDSIDTSNTIHIKAKWVVYTLTTLVDNDEAGTIESPYYNAKINKTAGEEITLKAQVNDTYSFLGWYFGDYLLSTMPKYTFKMPTRNVTYIAKWARYSFVTGKNIEEAGNVDNSNLQYITAGKEVTITATTNEGYTFDGWYFGDYLLSTMPKYTFKMPNYDATYTAKWSVYTLTTISNNDEAGTITTAYTNEKITITEGKQVTLCVESNKGYTFEGWYINGEYMSGSNMPISNESEDIYSYKFTISNNEITDANGNKVALNNNIICKATWEAQSKKYLVEYYKENLDGAYTLIYDDNKELNATTGTTVSVSVEPKKYGDHYILNKSKSILTGKVAGDESLVLRVYYDLETVKITIKADNGIEITTFYDGDYKYGTLIPNIVAPVTTKLGYEWDGWYSNGKKVIEYEIPAFYAFEEVDYLAKLKVKDEMSNFIFTHEKNNAANSCIIIGVKNKSISKIFIPEYITVIDSNAFNGCNNLTNITVSSDNLNYNSNEGLLYNNDKTEIVYIPKNISGIIILPNTINESVVDALKECNYLISITVSPDDENYSSYEGVLYNKEKTEIVYIPKNISGIVALPNTISIIGADVFSGRNKITGILFNGGTKDDWNSIEKADGWNNGLPEGCKVYCSNGTLVIA